MAGFLWTMLTLLSLKSLCLERQCQHHGLQELLLILFLRSRVPVIWHQGQVASLLAPASWMVIISTLWASPLSVAWCSCLWFLPCYSVFEATLYFIYWASLSSFELSLLFLNSLFGGSSFLPFFVRGLDPVGVSLKVNDLWSQQPTMSLSLSFPLSFLCIHSSLHLCYILLSWFAFYDWILLVQK